MMRHLVSTALLAGLLGPAGAQSPSQPEEPHRAALPSVPAVGQAYRPVRASRVIGQDVLSEAGARIGRLADLVVDLDTGRVQSAVLEVDPGWFSGARLIPVPTSYLRKGEGVDGLVGNIDRRELLQAAEDRPAWADRIYRDPAWSGIDQAWTLQRLAGQSVRLATNLLGKPVEGAGGESAAELEDLVIDLANRRVHYAVLQVPPTRASAGKRVVLPLSAIASVGAAGPLVVQGRAVDLSRLAALEAGDDRALDDPSLLREIRARLSAHAQAR